MAEPDESHPPSDVSSDASTPGGAVDLDAHGLPRSADGHEASRSLPVVVLAALGVVFGDIGTSPLYSLQTVFSIDHNAVAPTPLDVYGIISLVFWSVTLIVSVKYVAFVMRADNEGEGGILALTALLRRRYEQSRAALVVTLLGVLGAALFYGDSVITPAISVMSAVEGLELVQPSAAEVVVPVSVVILVVLFAAQRFGTAVVGRAFGPVMAMWFITIAALGVPQIVAHPEVLTGLSPTAALAFVVERPLVAFIAMGAVVLTITGAEALYADMGHFGARPIRLAWFVVVFPCLTLNYLGQGALILADPAAVDSPFFRLVPDGLLVPVVVLATAATVIASQAVISGAFSVSQQALNLGLLPRLAVRHTSRHEGGQIYVPTINVVLLVGVVGLVVGFRSSAALANAYGLAVTGTLILTTVLFGGVAHRVWRWPLWRLALFMLLVGGAEVVYFGANVTKLFHGGWLPVLISSVVVTIMTTWMWGTTRLRARRAAIQVPLQAWLERVNARGVARVPGQAIFLSPDLESVPLALKENLRFNHVIHECNVIVSVEVTGVPHVPHAQRVQVDTLGRDDDGIVGVRIRLGFNDSQDVPHNLEWSRGLCSEFDFDADQARYFLSVLDVHARPGGNVVDRWRRGLFVVLTRNAGSRVDAFRLPPERTAILGGSVYL